MEMFLYIFVWFLIIAPIIDILWWINKDKKKNNNMSLKKSKTIFEEKVFDDSIKSYKIYEDKNNKVNNINQKPLYYYFLAWIFIWFAIWFNIRNQEWTWNYISDLINKWAYLEMILNSILLWAVFIIIVLIYRWIKYWNK